MNNIRIISLCALIFLLSFLLGIYIRDQRLWPYSHFKEVQTFFKGDAEEKTSLKEKIENDLNFKPTRHIKTAETGVGHRMQFSEGFKTGKDKELKGLKLNPRRANPKIFLAANAPVGYRFILGTFDFENCLHGAILLNPEGTVVRSWNLSQKDLPWTHQDDTNIFPHGLEISPDGSFVMAFDEGNAMTKYDYCGNVVWRIEGVFHHAIAFDSENVIWSWKRRSFGEYETGELLVKIDYRTGKILKEIALTKIMDANPDIDIFGAGQDDTAEGSKWPKVSSGYWHVNDVDPLPKAFEQYYPNFSAGDLLISLRSPNLVFVMDPRTLKVKWWRQGLTRRQHDPDWNNRGTITIFNNNMHRGYSKIVEINPSTFEHRTLIDGEKYNFYTWWRGKHQMLPNGGFLITSSDQGRVFETDAKGDITFEFLNTYTDNKEYLAVSEARFLPQYFFKNLPKCE